MQKKDKLKKFFKIVSLSAAAAVILIIGILLWRLVTDRDAFEAWLTRYGEASRLVYIAITAAQVVLAIIPGEVLEIAGGYIFGAWEGTLLNLIGAMIGSIIVFVLVRKFGRPLVASVFSEEKVSKLRFLQDSQKRDLLFMIVFTLPGTPKDLLCYFAGLTTMKMPFFLIVASLGRIPAIVTSAIGGSAIEEGSYLVAVIAFAVAIAISLMGILIYRFISKKQKEN